MSIHKGNGEKQPPGRNETGDRVRQKREERLAEALRKNLQKRKAQARGRADNADAAEAPGDSD